MHNPTAPIDILLVEDNLNDIEITRRALEKGQVKNRLAIARNGEEALEILFGSNNNTPTPRLILLDLNLPKIDGREVLEKIKSDPKLRRIPVIVLTTSTREEDIVRSYDLGVNTFVTKPVRFDDFIRVVAAIQEYWVIIASLPPVE